MEIGELIDAAARAAVEHEPITHSEFCAYFNTHQRGDGLFAVSDKIVAMYFPASEDAAEIERARRGVIINGERIQMDSRETVFPAHKRAESAFWQFNYAVAVNVFGQHPVAAREKINSAILAGNIH